MIYLDSAATTLKKPSSVSNAMYRAIHTMTSPGRGGYQHSAKAAETLYLCRELAAELFGADDPEEVVFTFNATHALNIAIKSLVKPGDRVLISGYEHNAVTRPLHSIGNVDIKIAKGALFDPSQMLDSIKEHLQTGVSAVICTQVSNVFGYVLPIDEIASMCQQNDTALIVDASQSAGCLPVSLSRWKASYIAMPGHKGLYGPQGTGLLLCGRTPSPIIEGGTGSESVRQHMPEFLPDRVEAGTHNVPGIAGLTEGLRFIKKTGVKSIWNIEKKLLSHLIHQLSDMDEVELFCAPERNRDIQAGVLSMRFKDKDCQWAGEWLAKNGIAVRSGLHCAPLAHKTAGTLQTGTVRISLCAMTTKEEIDRFVSAVRRLVKE